MYYSLMVKECSHQTFIQFSHKELPVNKRFRFLCHWQLKKCHVITTLLKSLNWDLILNGMLRWTRKSDVIWYPLEPKAYYKESISSFTTLKICLDEAQLNINDINFFDENPLNMECKYQHRLVWMISFKVFKVIGPTIILIIL